MSVKRVAILGTLDTKGEEVRFLQQRIADLGLGTLVIDVGVLEPPASAPDISRADVAQAGGTSLEELLTRRDRGESMQAMARGSAVIARQLYEQGAIQGLISLGGSAGTSIGTSAMRALPVGFPKLMVSTLASGDTRPYVGTKDIAMLYSVVDISGINVLSRRILGNAAAAIAGMVQQEAADVSTERPLIGATMFGVTTPCVTEARKLLEAEGYEVLVFHATGTGGQAMEGLIADGFISGVLDITTTELADELVGGVLSAGPNRLEASGAKAIPQVVCPGAIDMVNFGPMETVPEKFKARKLYKHNPSVTLMRTTSDECRELGRVTAEKLNRSRGPAVLAIPLQGVSAIDIEGGPFYWPEANQAYLDAVKAHLDPQMRLVEVDAHINDKHFAETVARVLLEMLKSPRS